MLLLRRYHRSFNFDQYQGKSQPHLFYPKSCILVTWKWSSVFECKCGGSHFTLSSYHCKLTRNFTTIKFCMICWYKMYWIYLTYILFKCLAYASAAYKHTAWIIKTSYSECPWSVIRVVDQKFFWGGNPGLCSRRLAAKLILHFAPSIMFLNMVGCKLDLLDHKKRYVGWTIWNLFRKL